MSDAGGYKPFRQRLDAVLRRRDPAALRDFLVAEGQWEAEAHTDVEAAMWMMIATSPSLADMRDEARRWLTEHGHAAEAGAIFGRQGGGAQGQRSRGQQRRESQGARQAPAADRSQQAQRQGGQRPAGDQGRRPAAPRSERGEGPRHPRERPPRGPEQRRP